LENGNTLCKGKPIAYLIVWKSEKVSDEADPRTLASFSGRKSVLAQPVTARATFMMRDRVEVDRPCRCSIGGLFAITACLE
jgi:hypothetical protein